MMKYFIGYMAILALAVLFIDDAVTAPPLEQPKLVSYLDSELVANKYASAISNNLGMKFCDTKQNTKNI